MSLFLNLVAYEFNMKKIDFDEDFYQFFKKQYEIEKFKMDYLSENTEEYFDKNSKTTFKNSKFISKKSDNICRYDGICKKYNCKYIHNKNLCKFQENCRKGKRRCNYIHLI